MMKKSIWIVIWIALCGNMLFAQKHSDFLGAGHTNNITVTTSHNQSEVNPGNKTIDGFQVTDSIALKEASRFLAQATLGYDQETIQQVAAMGYEAWIDEQFAIPRKRIFELTQEVQEILAEDNEDDELPGIYAFRIAWWNMALKDPDLLRAKITHALSQIFVVSAFGNDVFFDVADLSSVYYDILQKNAFGNYRDLLSEVSTSVSMGIYLSHFNNPKSNPELNIHPDENYAREVMQLFSIGLYELNNDGTRKLDSLGRFIPTYDSDDIREFAKVFTGFGNGAPGSEFGEDFDFEDELLPMKMFDEWHEPGQKKLLRGKIAPAGQTGMQDFNDAMDNLANHSNVGPFIGKALIQFLVTANPSPAYVNRVAQAFNNGEGGRGNLKSVIKAILLDPEARNCDAESHPRSGKLREPIVRYTNFLKAFNPSTSVPIFIDPMIRWEEQIGQIPLYAPSVFNFYLPEFQPNGPIANQDLVAPVFQIHNSSTSIAYINEVNDWLFNDEPFPPELVEEALEAEGIDISLKLDFSDELALSNNPESLVDRLDILLAAGQLSLDTKKIIAEAVAQAETPEEKVDMAIYLIMISPEYAVLK